MLSFIFKKITLFFILGFFITSQVPAITIDGEIPDDPLVTKNSEIRYIPLSAVTIFSDDFNDNTKNYSKWSEIYNDGLWSEVNQQTELSVTATGPRVIEGIESSTFTPYFSTTQNINISWDVSSGIVAGSAWGRFGFRITDGTNWIESQYDRFNDTTHFMDSNDGGWTVLNNSQIDSNWTNFMGIFSDRYEVISGNWDFSGWVNDSIFTSGQPLKIQIYTSLINPNWSGTDNLTSGFDTIDVNGQINIPPVANNNWYVTSEDNTLLIPSPGILVNDNDSDGPNPLTVVLDTDVSHGTLTLNSSGGFSYTPAQGSTVTETFTYKAYDGGYYSNVARVYISITPTNDPPVAQFSWNPPNPQENELVTFNAGGSYDTDGDITMYEWDWESNGIFDETHTNPNATNAWLEAGSYHITLRVRDDDNLTNTITRTINILSNQHPVARFSWNPRNATINTTINFDASESYDPKGNQITTYEWDWNNNGVYEETHSSHSATHSFSDPGNYSVTLRVTNDIDEQDQITMTVNVIYIIVPDDFETIQGAIDHSGDGYQIFVRSGIYNENLVIDKEFLTIQGESKDNTIIDGNGRGHVVTITDNGFSVKISGFTIQNSGDNHAGLYVLADYTNCNDNIIIDNHEGLRLVKSNGNNLQANTIRDNTYGLVFYEKAHGSQIDGNIIMSNDQHGIYIQGVSTWNTINENIVSNNGGDGIHIDSISKGNIITFNQIKENKVGAYCSGYASGNFLHHNSFLDNEMNAWDNSVDSWDDDYPSGGNYWSDYTGDDEDSDGIGDIPYYIPGGDNIDRYPLVHQPVYQAKIMHDYHSNNQMLVLEMDKINPVPHHEICSDTIIVPDDYPTIQQAVDHAKDHDTILVREGTYYEHVTVNKTVRIVGENPEKTIVDGTWNNNHIFSILADDVEITGFRIQHCPGGFAGIRILSNRSFIHNNQIYETDAAVELWNRFYPLHNISIQNNMMSENNWGVYVGKNCHDSRIENNSIMRNLNGIQHGLSTTIICNNVVEQNLEMGIFLMVESSQVVIKGNSLSDNVGSGLSMWSVFNNTIEENEINKNNNDGISIWDSTGNIIRKNSIEMNTNYSISLKYFSNDNILVNNAITTHHQVGVHIFNSNDNFINNNNVINTNYSNCITLHDSSNNIISSNNFSYSSFRGKQAGGLRLYFSSINNILYHNNFLNGCDAYDECNNIWDVNLLSGNYWKHYTGIDSDHDGIGDIPYRIPGGSSEDEYSWRKQ